jgi:hypothetical protein
MTQFLNFPRHFAIVSLMGASLLGATLTTNPAQALTWSVDTGTKTDTNLLISGTFTIDDELANSPKITFSNVTVDGFTFGASDVLLISNTAGIGVTAIDWRDAGSNVLSFVFSNPLTPSGGMILLNETVSVYTPFASPLPQAVSGAVSPAGAVPTVPEPSTLLGVGITVALGAIFRLRRG